MKAVSIPEAVRDLLGWDWRECDSELIKKLHASDHCRYNFDTGAGIHDPVQRFTFKEIQALCETNAFPKSAIIEIKKDCISIDQHAVHSLHQFLYEAGIAYAKHLERMKAWLE